MLLIDVANKRQSVVELAGNANVPERIVVEALINLLHERWIEVTSTAEHTIFGATAVGTMRAAEEELRPSLRREIKWISLCMDRVTSSWMRSTDLDLVYRNDLPEGAFLVEERIGTLNYDDPDVRSLIYLNSNEGFEGFQPSARVPSRPFARFVVEYGEVREGLPGYAPLRLKEAILNVAEDAPEVSGSARPRSTDEEQQADSPRDLLTADDIIVGGLAHLDAVRTALASATTCVVIHSCFLHPATVKHLLPEFERAARRGVRVELLWGLRDDPESEERPIPISDTEAVLRMLEPSARSRVQLSPMSSGSHCKVIIYDRADRSEWVTVIGSCNFLSTLFDAIDVSLRTKSQRVAKQILGFLISAQLPPSGNWSPVARRLNLIWDAVRKSSSQRTEVGPHRLTLLADEDHYAYVTMVRDQAKDDIILGCDLYGVAAETSVLVPLERASQLGVRVRMFFQRPSRYLEQQGRIPDLQEVARRGIELQQVEELHGKFLICDRNDVAITSFNWLATAITGVRLRGAELGISVGGPSIRAILQDKLASTLIGRL